MEGCPIADAHCDFLYYMYNDAWSLFAPKGRQAVALPYMRTANVALQFFAAWVDADLKMSCMSQCLSLVDAYWRMLEESEGVLVPLTKEFNPGDGAIATVLTIEGGEAIEGSLEVLRMFHRLGARAMTLTWNFSNELASPAMRRMNKGLTSLGRRVVKEMHRIGMALDVAHLSDAGISEVLSSTDKPILASHSNSRAICPHKRSLCDAHIREISQGGGVICVNYYPPQLRGDGKEASASDVTRHIAHIASIAGVEHVALGSDFDGMCTYPADLKKQSDLPVLLSSLAEAGFSDAEIHRIAYDNLHDYILQFI
ncbi:MAG: dipeptidase [Candidatus Pelethousia sp.]|nr:dipeptidase [Candidatus Pelethousia sp.]